MRRHALLLLATASAACGLLAPPGGYSGEGTTDEGTLDGGGTDGPAGSDGTSTDGVAPPPPGSSGTIVVVSGERQPTSAADDPAWANDVWAGELDASGHVGSWRTLPSAAIPGPYDSLAIVSGSLFTLSFGIGVGGGRNSALQSTTWSPGPTGSWHANVANMPGGLNEPARAFFGKFVVTLGGTRDVPNDGGTVTVFTKEVHVATVDTAQTQLGNFGDPGTSLSQARSRSGVVAVGDRIYVVGGRGYSGILSSVETAKLDAINGGVEAFADQPPLSSGGAEYKVDKPTTAIGGGFVFVAGGRTNFAGLPSSVVLAGRIAADGTIAEWKTGAPLPKALRDLALVVKSGRLYALGGEIDAAGQTRSDDVYSATIAADGTVGAWETTANAKLPAPRSSLIAVAY